MSLSKFFGFPSGDDGKNSSSTSKDDLNSVMKRSEDPSESTAGASSNSKKAQRDNSRVNFDSSALERAARAAKYLENSKYAKDALDIARMQEKTMQDEIMKQSKAIEAQKEQLKIDQVKVSTNEKLRYLEEEAKQYKQKAEYTDHLARKRHDDELEKNIRNQDEILKRQESSLKRQEEMRRNTLEHEMEVRQKNDLKRIAAEYAAKSKAERENIDIKLGEIKLKAEEGRKTTMESIKTLSSAFSTGFTHLSNNPQSVVGLIASASALAVGIYAARAGTSTAFRVFEKRVSIPPLVRETSRLAASDFLFRPSASITKLSAWNRTKEIMNDLIFSPEMETKLRDIAIAAKFTKRNNGLYRNLLFTGPPGTGKTLFAKSLAKHSNIHYAILNGGDISPLGASAVTALHKIFDWAETSSKGTLIFIDEAEAFLRKRATKSDAEISENLRCALNAFLYRSGTQSNKFMLVLATNQPTQLDWAVSDRVDEVVGFDLPEESERSRLIRLYLQNYIFDLVEKSDPSKMNPLRRLMIGVKCILGRHSSRLKIDTSLNLDAVVKNLTINTKNFSGREISKMIAGFQSAALSSETGTLTQRIIEDQLQVSIRSHSEKQKWLSDLEKTPEVPQTPILKTLAKVNSKA
ncbi:MAG: ATPase, AAA [Marteilia pararefringens]